MDASKSFVVKPAQFEASGKFLLSAEYAVLDNVDALAIPLKLKQYLSITPRVDPDIYWTSYNADGAIWFDTKISLQELGVTSHIDHLDDTARKLIEILKTALRLSGFFNFNTGFDAVTRLDFDYQSGMGTSSTLIAMISQWVNCNPYQLQFECFGGSGYDVACATASNAIVYNYNNATPVVRQVTYRPSFTSALFFVYLNQKQNSRESIAAFDKNKLSIEKRRLLQEMPKRFLETENDLEAFKELLIEHEQLISSLIGIAPIKEQLFKDYPGAIKSLGGWGGDFILATGTKEDRYFFKNKGYRQLYSWNDLVD